MCHCKTCADRLHVIIIVIIAIEIPYSLASCLIRFQFLHTRIPFTSPRFLCITLSHDTSSKKAKLSSATTSFPWRNTNTSKNHGYNAVVDDACRRQNCRLLQSHFRDVTLTAARITDITLSRMTCRTRNCRLLQRHFRDVTLTPARITDITLSWITLAERKTVVCYKVISVTSH